MRVHRIWTRLHGRIASHSVEQIERTARNRDSAAKGQRREQQQQQHQLFDQTMHMNPYFNSLVGPRARTKRSNSGNGDNAEPSKAEYVKMLADSFPNPGETAETGGGGVGDSVDGGEGQHVRVKRSDE